MSADRYVAHQRRLAAQEAERRRAISTSIRARLPAVVQALVALGARRVLVFGSVARGDATDESDLDLAVEGLPPAEYFEAMARAAAAAGRPVDLVRLEEARPTLRDRILFEGELIHDGD